MLDKDEINHCSVSALPGRLADILQICVYQAAVLQEGWQTARSLGCHLQKHMWYQRASGCMRQYVGGF